MNTRVNIKNVYLPHQILNKIQLLDSLESLKPTLSHPFWLLGGDFNMITNLEENKGGRGCLDMDSLIFKDFILNNNLMDLQTTNGIYT